MSFQVRHNQNLLDTQSQIQTSAKYAAQIPEPKNAAIQTKKTPCVGN
jgi:hypothetical protein